MRARKVLALLSIVLMQYVHARKPLTPSQLITITKNVLSPLKPTELKEKVRSIYQSLPAADIKILKERKIDTAKFLNVLTKVEYGKSKLEDILKDNADLLSQFLKVSNDRIGFSLSSLTNALQRRLSLEGPGNVNVRFGPNLGLQEIKFRDNRLKKIRNHLTNFKPGNFTPRFSYKECKEPYNVTLNSRGEPDFSNIKQMPILGVSASGGGVRAMIAMLGAYLALAELGILDAVMYSAVLSGGSWGTYPWITRPNYEPDKPELAIQEQLNALKGSLTTENDPTTKKLSISKQLREHLKLNLIKKAVTGEPITFVDFYGFLIARSVLALAPNPFTVALNADTAKMFAQGDRLLPIGTAIIGEDTLADGTYPWLEVTPFEAGSFDMQTWIPTHAFGYQYGGGRSIQKGPAPYLGYMLGIFGSAFAISAEYMLKEMSPHIILKKLLTLATKKEGTAKKRWLAARINNPGHESLEATLFKNKGTLVLADAGLHFNNPLVPLVGNARGVNLIIIIDVSASVAKPITESNPGELGKAIKYFKQRGIKFPVTEISEIKDANKKPFSVFKNDELTVVYIPIPCPEGMETTCDTFNFTYSQRDVEKLANWSNSRVKEAGCAIMHSMQEISKQ